VPSTDSLNGASPQDWWGGGEMGSLDAWFFPEDDFSFIFCKHGS
jgi:hypothetical protein